ncbi:39s ribosomal protein mitochondrial [Lasius niger]|uniref:39s ribosomal protein mitochondrial n=1 Tax=Lasius niger TaxID=67767 RepID=A0A0J7N5Y7_LASNI|nr:39s ribosomal protein mitochondrial [Lasius niger]
MDLPVRIVRAGYNGVWHFAVSFYSWTFRAFFPTRCFSDIVIEGFMNIENRRFIRACRRQDRESFDQMWGDTADAREWEVNNSWMFEDIFDLRILFGMEPYDADHRSESWETPEDVSAVEEDPLSPQGRVEEESRSPESDNGEPLMKRPKLN